MFFFPYESIIINFKTNLFYNKSLFFKSNAFFFVFSVSRLFKYEVSFLWVFLACGFETSELG
jgi:hypothetical protein